jgi:pyruvate,water dikinase
MDVNAIIDRLRSLVKQTRQPRTPAEFERLFRSFRGIMDSNTHALEIITEMGDVLGGEYLFDIQYVLRALDDLDARVRNSLRQFEELTGKAHHDLEGTYLRIHREVRQAIEGAVPGAGELVLPLDRVDGSMAASAGGKMANLAEVKRALPLRVPDGFVVTTRGFDAYVIHNRVFEKAGPAEDRRLA